MPTKKNRKSKVKRGGGGGSGWTMGGPLVPGMSLDSTVRQQYDSCLSAARPGQIPFSMAGGIPGMKGGAYTNNLSAGSIGGFAQIDRDASHCMPNHVNTMNTGKLIQGGGASMGLGGANIAASAAPILEEHTARYTTMPSQWQDSVGAPILLNKALDGAMWSKACAQTGGRRRRRNKHKKAKRSTRRSKRSRKRSSSSSSKRSSSRKH